MTLDHADPPETFTPQIPAARTFALPANVRRLAWLAIVPVLALVAPVFASFGAREVPRAASAALSPVYFAAGTTQLRPRDMKLLDAHASWLREGKRFLVIEGHTDEPGDSAFSRAIGGQRAQSAMVYLVSKGVIADRITTVSRGGGRPVCGEKTPTCRARNRRATFSTGVLP